MSQLNHDAGVGDLSIEELLALVRRNHAKEESACVNVPLDTVLRGPGHVAWKLIQDVNEHPSNNCVFNAEQIEVIALLLWPVEQAWRTHVQGMLQVPATLDTLQKLPNDLALPRSLCLGMGAAAAKQLSCNLLLFPH